MSIEARVGLAYSMELDEPCNDREAGCMLELPLTLVSSDDKNMADHFKC